MARPCRPVPPTLGEGPVAHRAALWAVTPDVLRGPGFVGLLRGVHATSTPTTHGGWIRAVRCLLPDAVLGGRSALYALGAELAGPDDPVEVYLPPDLRVRSRTHLRVRGVVVAPDEVALTPFGRATSPARTAFDVARGALPDRAVPQLDALVRATGVRRSDVEAVARVHRGARWITRVGPALDLVDDGAESPRESALRVALVLAGLPRPQTQVVVRDRAGRFVGRGDLGWPELRVIVEYDGAHHDEPSQLARDRARLNAMRAAGWTVIVVDAAQFARLDATVSLIASVLRDAAAGR